MFQPPFMHNSCKTGEDFTNFFISIYLFNIIIQYSKIQQSVELQS